MAAVLVQVHRVYLSGLLVGPNHLLLEFIEEDLTFMAFVRIFDRLRSPGVVLGLGVVVLHPVVALREEHLHPLWTRRLHHVPRLRSAPLLLDGVLLLGEDGSADRDLTDFAGGFFLLSDQLLAGPTVPFLGARTLPFLLIGHLIEVVDELLLGCFLGFLLFDLVAPFGLFAFLSAERGTRILLHLLREKLVEPRHFLRTLLSLLLILSHLLLGFLVGGLDEGGDEVDGLSGGGPVRGFLLEELVHKVVQLVRIDLRQRLRLLVHNVVPQSDQVLSLERRLQARQMVNGAPYRPHIHFEIVRVLLDQLRGEVEGSADPGAVHGGRAGDDL
eukprot:CAMPEP_0170567152 /NCGR_PEP_ID=MMETSP0211-20121228/80297_1 /TAXON_ID=311385 /ORGANISM="Pseudokeronopsis sp., Strain OXSARD2" /LENGTH=328 /DNA_ID=CAMNT_0010888529 /DNA_START=1169 /DNA_END=2155 /DNA_ORIENTATION=+